MKGKNKTGPKLNLLYVASIRNDTSRARYEKVRRELSQTDQSIYELIDW